jgi:hypothetical protein
MSELAKRAERPAVSLFAELGRSCNGFGHREVVDAGFNLIINAFCLLYKNRDEALREWDAISVITKDKLVNCYDTSGRLKRAYFYNQVFPDNDGQQS